MLWQGDIQLGREQDSDKGNSGEVKERSQEGDRGRCAVL